MEVPFRPLDFTAFFLIFVTLMIGHSSLGEPVYPDPKVNKPKSTVDEGPPQSTSPLRPMDVGVPQEQDQTEDSFFYKYQSSVAVNLGAYFMEDTAPNTIMYGLLGATYLWYSPYFTHLETGVEEISSIEGHLWTMVRWQSSGTNRWRPFYGLGLGVRIIPQNGLATFLQLTDYFARAAYGAEYSVDGRQSWRGEISAACDFQGHPFVTLTLGYSLGI